MAVLLAATDAVVTEARSLQTVNTILNDAVLPEQKYHFLID